MRSAKQLIKSAKTLNSFLISHTESNDDGETVYINFKNEDDAKTFSDNENVSYFKTAMGDYLVIIASIEKETTTKLIEFSKKLMSLNLTTHDAVELLKLAGFKYIETTKGVSFLDEETVGFSYGHHAMVVLITDKFKADIEYKSNLKNMV